MAISTQGTVLKIKNGDSDVTTVNIKSFPDLGAAPAAIDVTTLADTVQTVSYTHLDVYKRQPIDPVQQFLLAMILSHEAEI